MNSSMHSKPPRYSKLLPCLSIQASWQRLVDLFTDAGIDCARQEASIVLQHVTRQAPTDFFANLQRTLLPAENSQVEAIVSRRLLREPLQYILNSAYFYGREFYVDSSVLIPRPETELVVELVREILPVLPQCAGGLRFADVGTGSGSVAVTLACEIPGARILAIDSSKEALQVARINAARHSVGDRVHLLQGDLLTAVGSRYSAIVANLPYIPTEDIQGLSPEVSCFEPRSALDGGANGLGAITRLCSQAAQALDTNGWLVLEVGEGQADRVQQLLSQQHMWESLRSVPDLRGVSRVVAGRTVGSHR